MKGFIYLLKDPRDNKIKYIGQTRFNLNKRYNEHLRNSKYLATKNYNVYCWINDLKNNNILPIIEKIEEIDVNLLNEREKYWILYHGNELKNMTKGGDGIKYINKRPFSVEHRKKIGNSCRGDKHYAYGKPAHNIKSIYQFDIKNGQLLNEYSSIKEAFLKTKILSAGISLCLVGKRNSAGNYIWIYKKEYDDNKNILFEKLNNCKLHLSNTMKSIKVNQINIKTNEIINTFTSIREAARSFETSDATIKYMCDKSKTHIYKNYKWEIKTDTYGMDS